MLKFLINRLASTLPVLGVVAIIVFAMLRMAPGDPVAMIAGENASAADMELMRKTGVPFRPAREEPDTSPTDMGVL